MEKFVVPTWAQHANGIGLGHWPEENRFTRLKWKGTGNTNLPFQIVSWGHAIRRAVLGEKLQPYDDLKGSHRGEGLHICRVGKSPGRFPTGVTPRESTQGHSRASGMWEKLSKRRRMPAQRAAQGWERRPQDVARWGRFRKAIMLNPPAV